MIRISRPAETLCETCSHGTVIRDACGIREVRCSAGMEDGRIHFRVVECSRFCDKNKTGRSDYEKTAWIIVPGRDRDQIGFLRPGTPEHKKATTMEY